MIELSTATAHLECTCHEIEFTAKPTAEPLTEDSDVDVPLCPACREWVDEQFKS